MTQIKSLSNSSLISNLKSLVKEEKQITAQVIHYLAEVQRRRLYFEHGHTSLYPFCIKELGYSEAEAHIRISAMRVMLEIPEIEEKITNGNLSLTNISQAQSFFKTQAKERPLTVTEKKEVLLILENKSSRECEKELVKLSPHKELPKEKVKQVSQE